MKSFSCVLLVVLALGAGTFASVNGVTCTADNCQGFSVIQSFSDSPDCTGNYTITSGENLTRGCFSTGSASNTSQLTTCSGSWLTIKSFYSASNATNCASSEFFMSVTQRSGICTITGSTTSTTIWCSYAEALASTARSVPLVNATTIQAMDSIECNATTGCGAGVSTMSFFNSSDCGEDSFLSLVPASYFIAGGPLEDNVCYLSNRTKSVYDNRRNLKATCGKSGPFTVAQNDGCGSSQLTTVSYETNKCVAVSGNQWLRVNCPSSSDAGTNNFSLLMVIAALLSALILQVSSLEM